MSKHSAACCKIPPVISEGYETKGDYVTINGLKTYVTGPADADTAILSIYDIFGFFPQTLQGADILAYSDTEHPYQVFVPDFFEGNPAPIEWYPPDNDDKKAKLGKWFETAAPPKHLPKIQAILADAEKHNSNIKTWGVIGYCWGGKLVSLIAGRDTKFSAGVQTSPAMVDPEDAAKVKIPMAVLASKEEDADAISKYESNLKVPKLVTTFSDQVHGFMSARGDLNDTNGKAKYEEGYKVALQFFHDNL